MDLRSFLAQAVQLELDAEMAYLHLVDLAAARGNQDASAFFGEMAGFSRLHRLTAMKRAGFASLADVPAIKGVLQGGETPDLAAANRPLDLEAANALAIAAETSGVAYYDEVARTATEPEIRALAEEFAAEERGHVLALERFLGLKPY